MWAAPRKQPGGKAGAAEPALSPRALDRDLERTERHLFRCHLAAFPELLTPCSLPRRLGGLGGIQADLYGGGRHRVRTADAAGGISRYRGSELGVKTYSDVWVLICSFEFVYFLFCFLSTQEISLWAPGRPGLGIGKEACH